MGSLSAEHIHAIHPDPGTAPLPVIWNQDTAFPRDLWSLLLIVLIAGLLTVSYIEGLTKLMAVYGAFMSSIFIVYGLHHRLELQPEVMLYFLWIVWSLGGLTNVVDRDLYFTQLKTMIQIGVLVLVISGITALRRNMATVMFALGLGGFLVAFSSIVTGEIFKMLNRTGSYRTSGITGNANEFAYCLLFVIVAVFYFSRRKLPGALKVLLAAVVGISLIFVLYSGSRKGLLGVLAFIFFWWSFCGSKRLSGNPLREYVLLLLLLTTAYFAVSYVMSNTLIGKRLEQIDSESDRTRIQMYQEGLSMIAEYPLFGVGLDNYRALSSSGLYSHSDYIEVVATTGIAGGIIYYSIYGLIWRRLSRIKKMTDNPDVIHTVGLLKAAIITILLIALGRPNLTSKVTWIFLAGAAGYSWAMEQALLKLRSLTPPAVRRASRSD